ncbi:MAG: [FeFe] hydrogenase H-cluster maturation GTPase HydF [Syntrophaceae bacterium]|nr:[FeFe] hydrogenase H-cluster maturation GTPase HydF [Syntrophaceae bacterium]
MDTTPKGNRLHVALFGRTNVGKSSLLNYLLGQDVAITSPVAGTTTDVVEKAAELLPLGPVLFLDTAGLDDATELAAKRLEKTRRILDRADAILLVTEAEDWTEFEENLLNEAKERKIPVIPVVNKTDLRAPSEAFLTSLREKAGRVLAVSSTDGAGREAALEAVKRHLLETAPDHFLEPPPLVGDLLPPGGLAVLVVPIDLQAPKGRLILPQVQTIRDALDSDAAALMVKERELAAMLARLVRPPDLVVTDSQAILKVSGDTPASVPLTTFSILMARQKGDLATAAAGVAAIERLRPGDPVLIAEACSHHPLQDDIGRVKIPRWLRQYVGGELAVDVSAGRDYPEDLSRYRLVIHCGACMLNRREMLSRLHKAREAGVPVTNYGLAISYTQGVIRRVLTPFPSALLAYERAAAAGTGLGRKS